MMRSCCVLSDPNRDNLPCFIPIKGKIKEVFGEEREQNAKKKGEKFMQAPMDNSCSTPEQHIRLN